jgi:hypothetical protein
VARDLARGYTNSNVPDQTGPSLGVAHTRCHVAGCRGPASYQAILFMALRGSERVSRVVLPLHVCGAHRAGFAERFLTPGRRSSMESSLRSRGHDAPDWARTHVDFVR